MDQAMVVRLGRSAFAICILCFGIQQLFFGYISPNFIPLALKDDMISKVLAYPWCIAFILSGFSYLLNKKAYEVSLVSGGVFLALFAFLYIPYLAFFHPNRSVFFEWAPVFMTIAFAGASLIFAGSFKREGTHPSQLIRKLESLISFGATFYSVMLVGYGAMHFVYARGVSAMVPGWIPLGPMFWTYFAGVALIGAGLAFTFKIKVTLVATLYGLMIFLWFLFLHIPRAIDNPTGAGGLELTRLFVTFGWTGIALLLRSKAG